MQPKQKAVFLDRDGVLNKRRVDDYVKTPSEFIWLDGAREGVLRLNREGWLAIVITNQRGIARGLMTLADVEAVHGKAQRELETIGAHIDAFYLCPHNSDEGCDCRKPQPGLILRAAKDWSIDLAASLLIGDTDSDIEAANRAGVRAWKMRTDGNLKEELEKALNG
jgi:D-glycero-D-manno-heptose 1,7-bisphosphate phosphatase